jgi:hypothetical protein
MERLMLEAESTTPITSIDDTTSKKKLNMVHAEFDIFKK